MNSYLGILLQLCDPTLPIGGYSHSNGLETYVQQNIVKDNTSAYEFIKSMIEHNWLYNDLFFVRLVYEAAENNNFEEILRLDQECTAFKTPREIRQAGRKLGIRTLKVFEPLVSSDLLNAYREAINKKLADGQYPVVFALYANEFNIPVQEALHAFLYSTTSSMITNTVKLVPLSQLAGQEILFKLQEIIEKTKEKVLHLDKSLLGICNAGLDIRCMQHENLYSRLYMS
ncbi:urease accessory protein UreF [Apibacter sp. HY039]|uniref:urease accessory protein UreF n=1 Tax=Apibacter sp. HY039 TaxID=2501476 RepID=UPI000FEBF2CA|nr:urease accessory protein UreF [Apibacter sp. HY039]